MAGREVQAEQTGLQEADGISVVLEAVEEAGVIRKELSDESVECFGERRDSLGLLEKRCGCVCHGELLKRYGEGKSGKESALWNVKEFSLG